jgi:hypothetical protein
MENKFKNVSMYGRFAYVNMCVEKYLVTKYADRDWSIISRELWKGTNEYWNEFTDSFAGLIPDVFISYKDYDSDELKISKSEYEQLVKTYDGITEGLEDDASDEVNYMLNKPFEMAMVYEGTEIGDGQESFDIIEETEQVLVKNNIALPDYTKVLFSSASEKNGWGNEFDGTHLSIILNK